MSMHVYDKFFFSFYGIALIVIKSFLYKLYSLQNLKELADNNDKDGFKKTYIEQVSTVWW